ncbi:MAG: glutamine amidotransferase-related protein [Burkholderiales bacterium]
MKIALLGCDDVPQRFRHIAGGYHDMFAALLGPHIPNLDLEWIEVYRDAAPPAPGAFDAYLCTGSRWSVYEDRGWIRELKYFIGRLHEDGTPFVGICFGHQMLAEALGGNVERAEYGWGIGVHTMHVVKHEDWMSPPLERCKLLYMHADQVRTMPPDSVLLASAEHCPVAMFKVGDSMLGIEGHPEFPAAYEEALLLDRKERIGTERVDAALASLKDRTDERLIGAWIARFLRQ